MLSALGRLCVRRRWYVLATWAVLLALGVAFGSQVFARTTESRGPATYEASQGFAALEAAQPGGGTVSGLVDNVAVDDPAVRAAVQRATGALQGVPGVLSVADPYAPGRPDLRARDGRALLVSVTLVRDADDATGTRVLEAVRRELAAVPGARVGLGGDLATQRTFSELSERDLARGEATTLPLALVALLFVFGGLVAALLPVAAALVTAAVTLLVLLAATRFIDVAQETTNIVTVLALGLSVDYSLLMVSRFREERAAGLDVPAAVERTTAAAGRTITYSALTVAASLAGLFVFDDPAFRSFAVGGVGVVLVALLSGLTLVPALLAVAAGRVGRVRRPARDDGFFYRTTRRAQRHPLLVLLTVAGLLVGAALPFLDARFQVGDERLLPASAEPRQVQDALASRFPGQGSSPVLVVARGTAPDDPRLAAYAEQVRARGDVADVKVQPVAERTALLQVTARGESEGEVAEQVVHALRTDRGGLDTLVTGSAAFLVDFKAEIVRKLPYGLALIGTATLVLLFLMTGSLLVPVKALVMNVLSLGATFGALVWVFQEGHLSGLLGFEPAGGVLLFVPIIVFVFGFGLSMDYEVFLLARIQELHAAGYDNDTAVALGVQRSGRIITSAALLVVLVFAGFGLGELLSIKEVGVALALAVAVDATLVRCLLVPATMTLLGDRNWWAPGPLRRLHDRIGLSEVPSPPAQPAPQPAASS